MQLRTNTQVWRLLNTHLPRVAEATPPRRPPTNGGARGRGERRLRCWQQVALVTRCGGGREGGGMFPDVLSPFIIFLIPQTPSRAAAAALRPAPRREEGRGAGSRTGAVTSRVFAQLLPLPVNSPLLSLFWESAARVNTGQACLSARIFKRQRAPVALAWGWLSARLVFPPLTSQESPPDQRKSVVFAFLVFPGLVAPLRARRVGPIYIYVRARVRARALIGSERAA